MGKEITKQITNQFNMKCDNSMNALSNNNKNLEAIKSNHFLQYAMEENKQKIIAMAMQLCVESSDDSCSDDSDREIYRVAKRPKLQSIVTDIDQIPITDLNLIKQFCIELLPDQQNFLRLDDLTFQKLLALFEPTIQKLEIQKKQLLTARERLVLTLSYLSTGRNYNELLFNSSKTSKTIEKIVLETCDNLYKCLRNQYMKVKIFYQ